jgi:hypothetical protein
MGLSAPLSEPHSPTTRTLFSYQVGSDSSLTSQGRGIFKMPGKAVIDFESAKLASLKRRARQIGANVLTGQLPNKFLGDGAGTFTLADLHTGDPVRVPGVNLTLLELQIRRLETYP